MTNIKPLFVVVAFVIVSLVFGSYIRGSVVDLSSNLINSYYKITSGIKDKINEHFRQAEEISSLRAQNMELQKTAMLLSTFAGELNQILVDKNSSKYEPKVRLAKTLSYANISDYNKFWVDFDEFDPKKVYGLISEGKSMGILIAKDEKPLAILQKDEKSVFSVYIGESRIPGLAGGNGKEVVVRYIEKWKEPKIGDEVYTTGMDSIFFGGVPVGVVEKIIDEDLYKSAVIKPYADPNIPAFLYIVTKEN